MGQIILDSANDLIQGDFDNATLNNRTKFRTTTTNATTNVYVVPNGSATSAGVSISNNSNLTNASKIVMATNGTTDTQIISGINGSGTYLPLSFYTNDTLVGQFTTAGNLSFNSGYGSVAVAYGCRAWVKFTGTGTVAINGSGNVSSITDTGTGTYTVNFTTSMPDTNYSVASIADDNGGNNPFIITVRSSGYATSNVQIGVWVSNQGRGDPPQVNVAIFR
jgi:hypothetical protein